MLKAHPLAGVGYRSFTEFNEKTAHNSFVLCFAKLGLVGYFFWLALSVITLLELRWVAAIEQETPFDGELRRWALAVEASLLVFLTAALFLSRTYVMTLYLLIAMGVAIVDVARRSQTALPRFPLLRWGAGVAALEITSIAFIYAVVRLRFLAP